MSTSNRLRDFKFGQIGWIGVDTFAEFVIGWGFCIVTSPLWGPLWLLGALRIKLFGVAPNTEFTGRH